MFSMSSYYLAHQQAIREFVRPVELALEAELGIDLRNPFMDGFPWRGKTVNPQETPQEQLRAVELKFIRESDGLVAFCIFHSLGTDTEVSYAIDHGKPVIAYIPKGSLWDPNHPFLAGAKVCSTLEELKDLLKLREMKVINGN